MKKKLKDTKLGLWLKDKAPSVLNTVGDLLPDKGVLGIVKNLISSSTDVSDDSEKEFNEKEGEFLAEMEKAQVEFEKTITDRWKSDNEAGSWLSRNIRPATLLLLLIVIIALAFADSITGWDFEVKESYTGLFETLLVTVVIAYFGSRGAEKVMKTIKK